MDGKATDATDATEDYCPEGEVQHFQACDDPPETDRLAMRQAMEKAVKANIEAAQV